MIKWIKTANLKPQNIISLKCYAIKYNVKSWYGVCLDLNLIVYGDSVIEVRKNLHNLIIDYLNEAFTVDKNHFSDLVPRKAPMPCWIEYYLVRLIRHVFSIDATIYTEQMPLALAKA